MSIPLVLSMTPSSHAVTAVWQHNSAEVCWSNVVYTPFQQDGVLSVVNGGTSRHTARGGRALHHGTLVLAIPE